MPVKFTHLHVHSHYSLLDGLPKIDELLDYVKDLGMESIAITDHGAIHGAVEFYKKAKQRNIKAIIGAELYMAFESRFQKRPHIDDKRYHIVLIVKNEIGYKNLVKLITKSHLEGFYYKPRIDQELLRNHSQGLICLSACLQGKIPKLILSKKIQEAEELALQYQEIFGKDNFYLELQNHPNIKEQKIVNDAILQISKKHNILLVATNDCHYLRSEDAKIQDVLMLINTGADPKDPERLTLNSDDFSMKSPERMIEEFKHVPEAIENTQRIAELCSFEFKLGEIKLPHFETQNERNPHEYLKKLCQEGLKKKFGQKPKKEVLERLEQELNVIKETGFSSYFLIVQDFVNFAKQKQIICSARGTANSSLVSYLLNISNIDPIKYNLYFERFLNPERISPADIDIDFADNRRDEVINYVSEKYGKDKVSQIVTFGTMAARAAIRDVGRALLYSYTYCDKIAKMIPFGFTLKEVLKKVKEFQNIYEEDIKAKELIDLALTLEGVARHASTHACGVVISAEPLENLVPLQHPTQDDKTIVTQYDMHSIEDLGILKMDFLGLKNLTIIEDTLGRIKTNYEKNIDIEKISLQDKETYKTLKEGRTTGIFQLEGQGMTRYLMELKPTEFEDIIAMVALFRPGPMALIPSYIKRKNNEEKVEYLHPKLKPILENTYGICCYQEQLMQIAKDLAGFTLGQADVLRKAVGKKIKSLLDTQRDKLIKGMENNNISLEIANKIWKWILPFARYGFPRAHAAAYALIAYQTAWLKTHYPVEFMASVLCSENANVEKIAFLIKECERMGIKVLPPDINESNVDFSVSEKNQIRFGLLAIKNVGWNVVQEIVEERKKEGQYQSIGDFLKRISVNCLNKKSLESLIKAGVFDKLGERNMLLQNIEKLLDWARQNQKQKLGGQKGLFDEMKINSEPYLDSVPPAPKKERVLWEKELLGLFVTSHPLEDLKNIFEKSAFPITSIVREFFGKRVKIGGIISNIKKIITKNGKPMVFLTLEDQTDKIEVIAFPSIVERNLHVLRENKIVFVSGKVDAKDGIPKIICEEIEEIVEK